MRYLMLVLIMCHSVFIASDALAHMPVQLLIVSDVSDETTVFFSEAIKKEF